jgi:serine/threonine protein kinase
MRVFECFLRLLFASVIMNSNPFAIKDIPYDKFLETYLFKELLQSSTNVQIFSAIRTYTNTGENSTESPQPPSNPNLEQFLVRLINTNATDLMSALESEIELRRMIGENPFLVNLISRTNSTNAFHEGSKAITVYEYPNGGSLLQYVKRGPHGNRKAKGISTIDSGVDGMRIMGKILGHILTGLQVMHEHEIFHGNLRTKSIIVSFPENPMTVDPRSRQSRLIEASFKISNLGIFLDSILIPQRTIDLDEFRKLAPYLSPQALECCFNQCPDRPSVVQNGLADDMWAVGIIAFELWTGRLPWEHFFFKKRSTQNPSDSPEIEIKERAKILAERWIEVLSKGYLASSMENFPSELSEFILKCLALDRNERITASTALEMGFISSALNEDH